MKELTHAEAFDWVAEHHAQCWFDKHSNKWTVQVIPTAGKVIQPSAYSLWVAVQLAHEQLTEWTTFSKTS